MPLFCHNSRFAIHTAEDREAFKRAMARAGLPMPDSGTAHTLEEARAVLEQLGFDARQVLRDYLAVPQSRTPTENVRARVAAFLAWIRDEMACIAEHGAGMRFFDL